MRTHFYALSLAATLGLAGCATLGGEEARTPAAASPDADRARKGYEGAHALADKKSLGPKEARQGLEWESWCAGAIGDLERLKDESGFGPPRPLYDPQAEKIPTAYGDRTLAQMRAECESWVPRFEAADLYPRPKPVAKDRRLEAKMLESIQAHGRHEGWSESFDGIILTTREWEMLRHSRTGVLMGRVRDAAATARWPDGHCTVQSFTFEQEQDGSGFSGPLYVIDVGLDQNRVQCAGAPSASREPRGRKVATAGPQ